MMDATPAVFQWSTDDVPARHRFDYFADALGSAIVPMQVEGAIDATFAAHMTMAEFGPVAVIHQNGTSHRSYRRREDVSRSGENSFHLIVNRSTAWTISHCGDVRVAPGEVLIADSRYGHDLAVPDGFDIVHVKLGDGWTRRWMPRPEHVVGRPLGRGSVWGPALSAFVSRLTPDMIGQAAVPASVLIDQVGAMLSLVATEMSGYEAASPRDGKRLRDRIRDCMAQRCGERALDAAAIAATLRVDEAALHAALASAGETFSGLLTGIRLDVSVRMLRSRSFREFSVAEIAERAGFDNAGVFGHALRRHLGTTPSRLRLDAGS